MYQVTVVRRNKKFTKIYKHSHSVKALHKFESSLRGFKVTRENQLIRVPSLVSFKIEKLTVEKELQIGDL